MLFWLMKQLFLFKLYEWLGRRVAKRLQVKYGLGKDFEQTFSKSHDVNWKEVKHYATLSKLVYNKNPKDITKKYPDAYVNHINKIRYFMITDDSSKSYTIVNVRNIFQDLKFNKDRSKRLGCKLHSGFHKVAEEIFDDLKPQMSKKSYKIFVTGHSLGGAEAVIIGAYCDQANMKLSKIVTFGQPKVFDRDGAKKWGHLPLTRVVNETDVVPLVPPVELVYMFKRYVHFGKMIKLLDKEYYCFLEDAQARNMGVNSFWLNSAKTGFSMWNMGKEMPDHFMKNYVANIMPKINGGKEVLWKDREAFLMEDLRKEKK